MEALDLASSIIGDPRTLKELGREDLGDVLALLDVCRQEMAQGPWPLVEVQDRGRDIYVIGDLHGDLLTARFIASALLIMPSLKSPKDDPLPLLLFLGDYVDRPPDEVAGGGLLTAIFVLALRIAYPDNVILLRGNHEGGDLARFSPYDLPDEIGERFGREDADEVHDAFIRTFSAMPLMVRIDGGAFCTHASFPRRKDPRVLTPLDHEGIMRTIWGDPVVSVPYFSGRGMGHSFNEEELASFLRKMDCKVLIRGHDPPLQGIPLFHDSMLTITTSRIYKRQGAGGVLIVRIDRGMRPESVKDLQLIDVKDGSFAELEWRS